MADYAKPLPTPDPVTKPFWDSLKAQAIQLQKCGDCQTFVFYPKPQFAADTPKIQLTKDGAVWFAPRGSR